LMNTSAHSNAPALLTTALTRGADGRDACESTRRDRTNRQVKRVVGLLAH
jgi:hypothetical protein